MSCWHVSPIHLLSAETTHHVVAVGVFFGFINMERWWNSPCETSVLLPQHLVHLPLPPTAPLSPPALLPPSPTDNVCNTKSIIFVTVITIPCKTIRKKKNDNKKKVMQKFLEFFYHLIWCVTSPDHLRKPWGGLKLRRPKHSVAHFNYLVVNSWRSH